MLLFCSTEAYLAISYICYKGCSSQCCPPNPIDCTEVVSENDQAEWLALKYACDNQTTCNYLFRGAVFVEEACGTGEDVQYLNVYYSCLPGISGKACIS